MQETKDFRIGQVLLDRIERVTWTRLSSRCPWLRRNSRISRLILSTTRSLAAYVGSVLSEATLPMVSSRNRKADIAVTHTHIHMQLYILYHPGAGGTRYTNAVYVATPTATERGGANTQGEGGGTKHHVHGGGVCDTAPPIHQLCVRAIYGW